MKVNIHASWEVNDYLNQVIHDHLQKLQTFYEGIIYADVYLKNGDGEGVKDKTVEIKLGIPGPDVFAQESEETLEKAVASTAEKLRRQLKKVKEKSKPF